MSCDIFRGCNPDVKRFIWRYKNPLIQRGLYYFILSGGLQGSIEIIDIIPSVQSSHSVLRLKILENRFETLEIKSATSSDEEIVEQYYVAKNELESIYDYITEGIILRLKASWYEHGEKSTQYSFS